MDSLVWGWFVQEGRDRSIEALGEAVKEVAEDQDVPLEKCWIHFSFDGRQRYATVVRIPVRGEGDQRYEAMEAIEQAFYRLLEESLDTDTFAWLRDEVSLAFLSR